MKHIAVSGDSFIVYGHDETPDPAVGTIYPAENTPVLTAADDEVCEQETHYIIENGVAKLLNSLRKKTVAEIASTQSAMLKFSRNAAEAASPFVYDGSSFDYDPLSRERINAAISGATIAAVSGTATNTVVAEWTLSDNSKRNMTIADWLAFRIAEISRSAACHSKYNTKKAAVAGYVAEYDADTMTADAAKAAIQAVAWEGE